MTADVPCRGSGLDGSRGAPAPTATPTVSFGDYHVAKDVGWAAAGALDDAELAEFSRVAAPPRAGADPGRARRGGRRLRHGARMAPRTHLPARVTRT